MSTKLNTFLFSLPIILIISHITAKEEVCYDHNCEEITDFNRYLLYDVNPPEGFNLRRDVYMRLAILAHKLNRSEDENLKSFKLVLPPWSHLYHWKYKQDPECIPWGLYFNLDSLKSFAPVIEMHEFFNAINNKYSVVIDETYILQHFEEMFDTGIFEDKMLIEDCVKTKQLTYFYYRNITSRNVQCLSFHGPANNLMKFLSTTKAKTILLHHAEVTLHEMYGSKLYWQCRRSMRFNDELKDIAKHFRKTFLNSTDKVDNTLLPNKWQDEKAHRNALGGPYLCVHLRRRDFLKGRSEQMPTVESIANQITNSLKKLNLKTVFIATDTTDEEYNQIIALIPSYFKALKYVEDPNIRNKYGDGGIAIIEQIICSYARHFIGTQESTFSFRIQEEREILGFPVDSTFNNFCKDNQTCIKPSVWKIVY